MLLTTILLLAGNTKSKAGIFKTVKKLLITGICTLAPP
jgi:hypothetical protein